MQKGTLKADILLLLTAIIWGSAFVAQRVGMEYVGPFTFNGVRFALGSLSLLPLITVTRKKQRSGGEEQPRLEPRTVLGASILAGLVLFLGASFQQVGIVYTTAGKAGFITGMYVILVPIIGTRWGQKTSTGTWIGAVMAITGLYLLSVTGDFNISKGDLLVLISAFFWAGHVLLLGWLSPKTDSLVLASTQFAVCSVLSMMTAFGVETVALDSIIRGAIPILYGGLLSVGIAYTLQVVAQRTAHPAHASIILTMEGAFAAIGGWLLLNEVLSMRSLVGCALMLAGMLVSQLAGYLFPERTS
jgi:drug/metabolite transporter (DMT)-like permease